MKKIPWPHPFNAILRGLSRRRTINELSALPDHLLADIGIERDAIPTVVSGMMKPHAAASGHRPVSGVQTATAANDLLLLSRV